MADPVQGKGWLRRNAPWLFAGLAVALIALLAVCGVGVYRFLEGLKGMDDAPRHMTPQQVTAFEERYRDKGSVEQAAKDLEAVIAKTADKIAALVPGLTWKWKDDTANVGCPQDPASDTRVTRFWVRTALLSGPIPEDVWPQAVAIVQSEAQFLGMTAQFKYQDAAKQHDLVFSSADGGEIRIATAVQALITGKTPCRLMEYWYTDRGIPVPSTGEEPR
ncbi:lipoprotein LppV [Segniliparus rotundus DSM 44985]|uniref:Lipoprotein LppV n=1 Tax=Segniliparus rotundus (strain ATCC BAA-972 / CDC 1076 / CIP 108378 / DSM 44985 / JCM 13578) TaxID=640132 RepID=D6ZFG5_SEGRD|nr:LppA family lipoprotein [Segniliparus rotundus]ADG97689.1 lipoprotein LppV [Segniliparus rotundus DSM 44985]